MFIVRFVLYTELYVDDFRGDDVGVVVLGAVVDYDMLANAGDVVESGSVDVGWEVMDESIVMVKLGEEVLITI